MNSVYNIALFGEAEKGRYHTAYYCESLPQLVEYLGHPPPESLGLYFAVQALMYEHRLIFFRVEEEGFSYHDYLLGLKLLEEELFAEKLAALCLPGVGDARLIEAATPICEEKHALIITSEADLYDYLTSAA